MDEKTPYINDFANRSFRDHADQDYIMARIAYRKEFDQQFRWCSLQALEKYLKAILLYNRVSAKGVGHDLVEGVKRVKGISDLDFTLLSSDTTKFIEYISSYGADRYLSHPTHFRDNALLTLDKTVWCVRRYCFFMRQVVKKDGGEISLFEANKKKATNAYYETNRHKYRIFNGYLEKVIDKRLSSYDDLVWKNFFYGRVKKQKIKNFKFRMSSQNPTHSLHPEIFVTLDQLVDFPKAIRNEYKS
jgi:HEPN domain-containing protein